MPAQAQLSINDSVPAARIFAVGGVVNGVATWYEKTSSVVSGYWRLSFSMKFPKSAGDAVRHAMKIVMPTTATETINGVTYAKITRQSMVAAEAVIAPDAVILERRDLCAMTANLFSYASSGLFGWQIVNTDPTT